MIAETRETPKPIFIASDKERYPSLAFLKTINEYIIVPDDIKSATMPAVESFL